MESYITPGVILCLIAIGVIGLRAAVDFRSLITIPARKEHITREEYAKDEKARKEQLRALRLKCLHNARGRRSDRDRSDKEFKLLVAGLAELKIQLARLATVMEERERRPAAVEPTESPKEHL